MAQRHFCVLLLASLSVLGVRADAQSLSTIELSHGFDTRRTMIGPQVHWYRISQEPFSSYEVLVEGVSGVGSIGLTRYASDATTVLQTGNLAGVKAVALRWSNDTGSTTTGKVIRVAFKCDVPCTTDNTYRIRAAETTYALVRFNNAAPQFTVIQLFNRTAAGVAGHIDFWSEAGQLLHSHSFALTPKARIDLNVAALPGLAAIGGSATLRHSGPHGALVGKAVDLHPEAGLAFDTALPAKAQ